MKATSIKNTGFAVCMRWLQLEHTILVPYVNKFKGATVRVLLLSYTDAQPMIVGTHQQC